MSKQTKSETDDRREQFAMATWRIPNALHQRLKNVAAANRVNLTQEVRERLAASFDLPPHRGLDELEAAYREHLGKISELDGYLETLTKHVLATLGGRLERIGEWLDERTTRLVIEHRKLIEERERRLALLAREEELAARREAAQTRLETLIAKLEGAVR